MKKKLMLTMMLLSISATVFAAPSAYSDVPKDNWAYQSITKLAKAGIIEGYGDGSFQGTKPMTRYEMAIIVANAMTKEEKADSAAKAELEKLKTEFGTELDKLGVRMTAVEKKVNGFGNTQFNIQARYIYNTVQNSKTSNHAGQFNRYRLYSTTQLDDNAWFIGRIGTEDNLIEGGKNTNSIGVAQSYLKIKTGDWYVNLGRQTDNLSDPAARIATGMIWSGTAGFDGISAYTKKGNNKFFVGAFQKSFGSLKYNDYGTAYGTDNTPLNSGVRSLYIANATYDVTPNLNLVAGYVKDQGIKGTPNSSIMDLKTVGAYYTFGADRMLTLTGEYATNSRAKYASQDPASSEKGWYTNLRYGKLDTKKVGSWNVQLEYRKIAAGVQANGGSEYIGGLLTTTAAGAIANCDNVQGTSVYYEFVPFKNVFTQLSWHNFKAIDGGDQKYRQGVRLLVNVSY